MHENHTFPPPGGEGKVWGSIPRLVSNQPLSDYGAETVNPAQVTSPLSLKESVTTQRTA